MIIILFDTPQTHTAFYPLSSTKPVARLRHGILTLQERWQRTTDLPVYTLGESYLPADTIPQTDTYLYIDATFLPTAVEELFALQDEQALMFQGRLVAVKTKHLLAYPIINEALKEIGKNDLPKAEFLQTPWQLFQTNVQALVADYELLTGDRTSQPIHATNIITGGTDIFIEEGAEVKGCFLNASEGPIYIGKDALVMEGTAIRGPVAICEKAVAKMGAKLYGGTTIGPHCTAGGEIKNAILSGYSNKAHDGYLGDAVLGEWCNLGAGTTNSNVKNTAGVVKMWSEAAGELVPVGKKAGLIMGDYSRSAVNTGFNTGTVVGVCSNVFGDGQPPKHVPSFTWGTELYQFDKALADIDRWKQFKGQQLEESEKDMLAEIYQNVLPTESI